MIIDGEGEYAGPSKWDNVVWQRLDAAGFITGAWRGLQLNELPEDEVKAFCEAVADL